MRSWGDRRQLSGRLPVGPLVFGTALLFALPLGCGDLDIVESPADGPRLPDAEAPRDLGPEADAPPDVVAGDGADAGGCLTPADCDDDDDCTDDLCDPETRTCSYESIIPCCGNLLCDTGESCNTCTMDCGECGCCIAHSAPGCSGASTRSCVCAADPACCSVAWDADCVAQVTTLACGSCDCCTAHADGGCQPAAVSDCVCATDAFCCNSEWDPTCVDEVTELACGTCP